MSDEILDFFFKNSKVCKIENFKDLYFESKPSVYEVIRIIDRTPLFLEEHYERLVNSINLLGKSLHLSYSTLKDTIIKLIELNNISEVNLKIVINAFEKENPDVYLYFIKSSYPDQTSYINGVKTFQYDAERSNPNAKIIDLNLRNEINRILDEKNCYEAILVNKHGEITEGSRSNLFFIKGSTIYTAASKDVLLGITRQRIIRLCGEMNIEAKEEIIKTTDLENFESAFISGTSPKVLPISAIDTLKFSTDNQVLQKIVNAYDNEINNYIKNFRL